MLLKYQHSVVQHCGYLQTNVPTSVMEMIPHLSFLSFYSSLYTLIILLELLISPEVIGMGKLLRFSSVKGISEVVIL